MLDIENDLNSGNDELDKDSTEALLNEYDKRRTGKADDTAAMQATVCIILAFTLLLLNMLSPDTADALFTKLTELSNNKQELFPNPIELILRLM